MSSHWVREMEKKFRTSPYPLGAKAQFAVDLLSRTTQIDCAFYCAFGIEDYVLGVIVVG